MEQRNLSTGERSKESIDKKMEEKQHSVGFQQHSHQHRRFLPLMGDNFYNCELCGVGIAVLQIVTDSDKGEGQFKVCCACLKKYIDEETA
jgi:hypothetical protein